MSDVSTIPQLDPDAVERALNRLPHTEREALLLKSREGLSYAEIGAVLGLTAAQAEARVASALVRLHARLLGPGRPWWRFW
jgi:DNA-directed RNA polymerase specialized sigma24 family protein